MTLPMSNYEFKMCQRIVDEIDYEWSPATYYTVGYDNHTPSNEISEKLLYLCERFKGEPITVPTISSMQNIVDDYLHVSKAKQEMLVWVDECGFPSIIDRICVQNLGNGYIRLAPMLDKTRIMEDVLSKLNRTTQEENL